MEAHGSLERTSTGNNTLGSCPVQIRCSTTGSDVRGVDCLEKLRSDSETSRLRSQLPSCPDLHRGQLKNGLQYFVYHMESHRNNRFQAHMEVHVGSYDEEDDEQGMAHLIEHVVCMGSKKRKKLLETDQAQSNAYTSFHCTVFHINSATSSEDFDGDLFPYVLEVLNEITFHPEILDSVLEIERGVVLSEIQMRNTIDWRVLHQLYQHSHSENKLSKRWPMGQEEQIKSWHVDKLKKFHERWYFPQNASLCIVGYFNNITETINDMEAAFGQTGLKTSIVSSPASSIRLPLKHNWSLRGSNTGYKSPQIFQHDLIQDFSLYIRCKTPVEKVQTHSDLLIAVMKRIYLRALQFRIDARYECSNPLFKSITLDQHDSTREGCTITALTVIAEPKNWPDALKIAVHEVHRLKEFGITEDELRRCKNKLLLKGEFVADDVSSLKNVNAIMENVALGHTIMDLKERFHSVYFVAGKVTLEEINSIGAKVIEFVSDFGKPTAPLPSAIIASVPKKLHVEGKGEIEFNVSPTDITSAIKSGLEEPIDQEKPNFENGPKCEEITRLISSSELDDLWLERKPSFIPLRLDGNLTKVCCEETGITMRRLSNGISINYKVSDSTSPGGIVRLIVGSDRQVERSESRDALLVGLQTLREGGCVGNFSKEEVINFSENHSVNCSMGSTEELIFVDVTYANGDGIIAALQLLHMVLEHGVWLDDAFERAKQEYLNRFQSISKSLKDSTARQLMSAILNKYERFSEPTPKSLKKLTMQCVKNAVAKHFVGDNLEVNIVGDFSVEDIENCILEYLGTVKADRNLVLNKQHQYDPVVFRPSPSDLQSQRVFLKDTVERSYACIAGPIAKAYCGDAESLTKELLTEDGKNVENDFGGKFHSNPLFFGILMNLLAEIINSRFYTTMKESLGLTYDISFKITLLRSLNLGWYMISLPSTPGMVHEAVNACKNVLRDLWSNKISQRELGKARKSLLRRLKAGTKKNADWIDLLSTLHGFSFPIKHMACLSFKHLKVMYESASIEGLYLAYGQLKNDDNSIFSCIGFGRAQADQQEVSS